jgi:preprotein translocase subunit SecA
MKTLITLLIALAGFAAQAEQFDIEAYNALVREQREAIRQQRDALLEAETLAGVLASQRARQRAYAQAVARCGEYCHITNLFGE